MTPIVGAILATSLTRASIRATISISEDEGVERPAPGAAPTAFRVWKAGENPTSKGMTVFSRRSADLLLSDQTERGNLYSIDVDHMSLSDAAPPEHHRAVGWHRLAVRDTADGPELWAVDVEWTPEIKAALESTPPGFRYFSPAYDVERKTGEVVGYLNTALTNNPATYQVTALATRATQETTMKTRADVISSLKAMAEGDDKEMSAWATKMLKLAEGEEEKPKDEEKANDDEKKEASEGDDEKKETKATDDEEKKDSVAASLSKDDVVKVIRAELQSVKDDAERDRLIASRKDLPEKFLATLKDKPLDHVRESLDALPVSAKRNPAADATIQATRGSTQGDDRSPRLTPEEKAKLDERMGIAPRRASIRREGSAVVFGVMTNEDATSFLSTKNGGK